MKHPFAASPDDDRRAILHPDVRLHPDDRELTGPEWAETAHRLARAAGIKIPGREHGCRWIAVQTQPGRIDLIANLIHLDGAWHAPPTAILRRLSEEARRIEQDHLLRLHTESRTRPAVRTAPSASAQLASVLTQLADEQVGSLAAVCELIEYTADRVAREPGAAGTKTVHRLKLLARRLHVFQQDLDTTATHLVPPRIAAVPPTTRRVAHRSP